ncbi:hypothetical protein [Nostoc sp. 'Peltigera membranacea cyanobiont' N6]|uniref:hypothetical protein n=1 Tax=Nostoc sp. 'Peltigera membranacea cyanobiont' N6 TaxID=1261031 RepID=UPI0015E450D0|nr:hypothetical protein [Nostoc sp. 'Peltigera membranacea cyanobiont' N6]
MTSSIYCYQKQGTVHPAGIGWSIGIHSITVPKRETVRPWLKLCPASILATDF